MKWFRGLLLVGLLVSATNTFAQHGYPANMFGDTLHAPFVYGVASGDPMTDRVMLWTKVVPSRRTAIVQVTWQVSEDSLFSSIVSEGSASAIEMHDHCVRVDAAGLQPGGRYFYRFISENGEVSAIGKARTLPQENVGKLKLAVVSCSSIWAGFFNAYARIAEREDVDFVVHLGDYVYDYPDSRQLNRMPSFPQEDVKDKEGWRERHKYYLMDADLRKARQEKTWIAEWDNHDIDLPDKAKTSDAIEVFYEYVPVRMMDPLHPEQIYRSFRFGKLAELHMIDMFYYRGKTEFAEGKKSVLGEAQFDWLKEQLKSSDAHWQLIGNQEMMTDWLSEDTPSFMRKQNGNGRVFDTGNWNGYPEDRQRFYDFLKENDLKNTVVLTGDIHMTFVMDMTGWPTCKTEYNKRTGEGSVGVEITGPSISRINMKESGVPGFLLPLVRSWSMGANPHHRWEEFGSHGYFTLEVTQEKSVAEIWFVPIKKQTIKQRMAKRFTVLSGQGHWER
ncbi:MAG: hypothetical protein GC178_11265 [Flavobacteriales bacterium]|nr:hypothetical protein [Flavobacteriales bacterium]